MKCDVHPVSQCLTRAGNWGLFFRDFIYFATAFAEKENTKGLQLNEFLPVGLSHVMR